NVNGGTVVAVETGGATFGFLVNGAMNVTGVSFARAGQNWGSSALQVGAGGHLTASNSTFAWSGMTLANGSVLNSGDLTTNGFDLPLSVPISDIPLLANNRRFQNVNILASTLSSGPALTLGPIGTDTTVNLRYFFIGSVTVQSG